MISHFNKNRTTPKWRLVWSLVALLAYSVQSLAFVSNPGYPLADRSVTSHSTLKSERHTSRNTLKVASQNTSHATKIKDNVGAQPTPTAQADSGCHGKHQAPPKTSIEPANAECCEGVCLMMDCHATSALVSTVNLPLFTAFSTQIQNLVLGFETKRPNTLYRPPSIR